MTTTTHFINLEAITCHLAGNVNIETASFVNDLWNAWKDNDGFFKAFTRWENMID